MTRGSKPHTAERARRQSRKGRTKTWRIRIKSRNSRSLAAPWLTHIPWLPFTPAERERRKPSNILARIIDESAAIVRRVGFQPCPPSKGPWFANDLG